MNCMRFGPPASQACYVARHIRSTALLGVETSKLSRRRRSQRKRAKITQVETHASADVFALDFDGVLVDSEPEV